METNNRKQLVTQDNGNIEKIFPKNYMSNIVDEETGESLRIFLLKYNHIDLGYRSSKSSARLAVPIIMRRKGLYITYYLPDDVVITEFFNGNKTEVSDTNWIKDELWVKDVNELNVYDVKISDGIITLDKLSEEVMQLISSKGDITINNFPDNEDLELYTIYQDSNNKIDAIRFKDRDNSNGMAYKYLRKTKNMILSQSDFNQANTIYEIRYDFDLNGNTISIPDNCELKFIGGSLKNGTINFNNTLLSGDIKIKTNILGDIRNGDIYPEWFGAVGDGIIDDSNAFLTAFEIISNSFISIDKFRRVGYTNTLVLNTNKEYYITSSLELNSVSINIKGAGTLIYGGKNHCMKFTKCTGVNIDISFIAKSDFIDTYKVDWNDNPNRTAIILDGVRESNFKFDKIVGFTKGIVVTGDGNYGCYNNYFKLASMYNLYKSIVIESFNQYWPNDNVVEGGYFIGNIDEVANTIINSPTAIRSFIEINGDSIYPITSWKFKDCYFQGQLAVLTNGDNIVTKVFYANQYCKNFKFENIAIEDTTSSTGSVFHFNNDQCKDIEIDTIDYVDNYNFNYLGFISNDWNYLKRLHNITFKQREGLQEIYRINVSKYYKVPFRVESSTNDDGGILLSNDLNPIFDLKNSKFVNRYNPNKSFPISGNLLSVTKGQIYYYDLKPAGNIRIIFMKSDYSVLTSNEYNSQTDIDIFSNIGITLSTYQDKSYYITGSTNGTNLTINMLNNTLIKYIYVCSSNSTELIISQNKYSTAVKNFIFENNQYRNGGFIINQNINSTMLTALTGDRIYNLYDNKEYRIINSGTKGLDLSDITVTAIKGDSYITVTGNISKFKIGNIIIIDNYQYTIRSISGQSLYVTPSIQSSVTNTTVSFKKLIFEDSDKNVDGTLLSKEVIVRSIDEITLPNIIYKIVSDIDLNNTTLTLPANCTLDFQGGSFSNGTIIGSNTKIIAGLQKIFNTNVTFSGTWVLEAMYPQWFGAIGNDVNDDTISFKSMFSAFKAMKAKILIPVGIYKITEPITVSYNNGSQVSGKIYAPIIEGISYIHEFNVGGGTQIKGYNIPNYRGVFEFLGIDNFYVSTTSIRNLDITLDYDTCSELSFCLFIGDSRNFNIENVTFKGFNSVLYRSGSYNGAKTYAMIACSFKNVVFATNRYINGSTITEKNKYGFALAYEGLFKELYPDGNTNPFNYADNISLDSCFIQGCIVHNFVTGVYNNCMWAIPGGYKPIDNNLFLSSLNTGPVDSSSFSCSIGVYFVSGSAVFNAPYFEDVPKCFYINRTTNLTILGIFALGTLNNVPVIDGSNYGCEYIMDTTSVSTPDSAITFIGGQFLKGDTGFSKRAVTCSGPGSLKLSGIRGDAISKQDIVILGNCINLIHEPLLRPLIPIELTFKGTINSDTRQYLNFDGDSTFTGYKVPQDCYITKVELIIKNALISDFKFNNGNVQVVSGSNTFIFLLNTDNMYSGSTVESSGNGQFYRISNVCNYDYNNQKWSRKNICSKGDTLQVYIKPTYSNLSFIGKEVVMKITLLDL